MKQTVTKSDFCDAFRVMDRLENFTYKGREMLFVYFEQLEEDTGEEIELDVIAICCDFGQEDWRDITQNYDIDLSDCDADDDKFGTVVEYLEEHTTVVGIDGESIVYAAF